MGALLCMLCLMGITPEPQQTVVKEKHVFHIHPEMPVVIEKQAAPAIQESLQVLFETLGYSLPVVYAEAHKAGAPGIYLGRASAHASFEKRKFRKWAKRAEDAGPGGYALVVDKEWALVAGADEAGVFYGVQSLLQIARAYAATWPCCEIQDWPDVSVRCAYVQGLMTTNDLQHLAALKCNYVLFDSVDFLQLEGVRAQAWKALFEEARCRYIEPIPTLHVLGNASLLLQQTPAAVEGRVQQDEIVLRGEEWSMLSKRNVIATPTAPIQVSVSHIPCQERVDYSWEQGGLESPFREISPPWLLRRLPGGGIPDGATVTVRYAYAPAESDSLCPYAPETKAALSKVLQQMHRLLKPKHIYLPLEPIGRLNQDLRTLAQRKDNATVVGDMIHLVDRLAKERCGKAALWIGGAALDPNQEGKRFNLLKAAEKFPKDAQLVLHFSSQKSLKSTVDWGTSLSTPLLFLCDGPASLGYQLCQLLSEQLDKISVKGVVVNDALTGEEVFEHTMDKAWSFSAPLLTWPEGLNESFQSALWKPVYPERLQALVSYLNQQVLVGEQPWELYEGFRDDLKPLRKRLPESDTDLEQAVALYENLSRYLSLEKEYSEKPKDGLLRDLIEVVEMQATLDPAMPPERAARIVETIREQKRFVPASILFGMHLSYVRPMDIPAGNRLFEVPFLAAFKDEKHRATADLDFLAHAGAVCRLEYETLDASQLEILESRDGSQYRSLPQKITAPFAGRLLLNPPLQQRYARICVESPHEQAVLRELHAYALKPPAVAVCSQTAMPVSGSKYDLSGTQWEEDPQAYGFLCVDAPRFATAPTEVRICRSRTHLFVGVTAREPRMEAMICDMTERDSALWKQESFEMIWKTSAKGPFRLLVNPRGAQYDSLSWDAAWDGDWQVMTRTEKDAWVAVIAIPLKMVQESVHAGEQWPVNFRRIRCNVNREESVWAHDYTEPSPYQYGTLRF